MANTPPTVKVAERLTDPNTYKKFAVYVLIAVAGVLLIVGGVSLWRFVFPKPEKQTNAPKVTGLVLPGGKVKIDQTNTQISMDEKPWEVGVGAGGIRYDNKDGYFLGGWVKRKW